MSWRRLLALIRFEHVENAVFQLVLKQTLKLSILGPVLTSPDLTWTYWLAAPAIELPIRHLRKPTRLETVKTSPITTSTIHFSLNVKSAVKNKQT